MKKLKPTDMRLLAYLYQHNREPLTKIAKALKMSREQVDYRLRQYETTGLIKRYLPVVSYTRLGYHHLIMLFLKARQPARITDLKECFRHDPHRITTVELQAQYDLALVLVFKDEQEKNEFVMRALANNKELIADHHVVEPYHLKFYPLKFLRNKLEKEYLWIDYQKGAVSLDEKEKKILALLNTNARMRIIEIAKKTHLSAELVLYKIKRLQKEGVLLGSRTQFDMQKLGYVYTILQLNFQHLSQQLAQKLMDFSKRSPHIDTFYLSITKPNCYLQLFHKTVQDIHESINALKDAFKGESFDLSVLPLKNEGEDINPLPFL